MPQIEGCERRPSIRCRLQYEFIARVAQLRSPGKPNRNRLGKYDDSIQENLDVRVRKARNLAMFIAMAHSCIFDDQRRACHKLKPAEARKPQQLC